MLISNVPNLHRNKKILKNFSILHKYEKGVSVFFEILYLNKIILQTHEVVQEIRCHVKCIYIVVSFCYFTKTEAVKQSSLTLPVTRYR